MDISPFHGLTLAPPGVGMDQFDDYIDETRRMLEEEYSGQQITTEMLVIAIKHRATVELHLMQSMEEISDDALEMAGVVNDENVINESLEHGLEAPDWQQAQISETMEHERVKRIRLDNPVLGLQDGFGDIAFEFNLIDKLCNNVELAVALGSQLDPEDLIKLYSVSKSFHDTINNNITSSIRMWVREHAAESSEIFSFKLYHHLCIPDPNAHRVPMSSFYRSGEEHPISVRHVPSLRWYHMVVLRERCVDDIIDALYTWGYHLPLGMERTLKKVWLLMDVATNKGRTEMIGNRLLWTRTDLYNVRVFLVKLSMRFGDPILQWTGGNSLVKLLLGQHGLYKMWQCLTDRRWSRPQEVGELKVRYDYIPTWAQFRKGLFSGKVLGVPSKEVGASHLQGWGLSIGHLKRPDELLIEEGERRGLSIDKHLIYMILWGPLSDGPFRRYQTDASYGLEMDFNDPNSFALDGLAAADADADADANADSDDDADADGDEDDNPYADYDFMQNPFAVNLGSSNELTFGFNFGSNQFTDWIRWSDLTSYEKSLVMFENIDPENIERQYIFDRQNDADELLSEDGQVGEDGESGDFAASDEEFLNLQALPDPNDPEQRQKHSLATAPVHNTIVPGNAPITTAIQNALDDVGRGAGPFADKVEEVYDYVCESFFGETRLPGDPEQFARAVRAWEDHQENDIDPAWNAYMEEINIPDDEELDGMNDLLFLHRDSDHEVPIFA